MNNCTKLGSVLIAVIMLAILPLSEAFSQNLVMETAGATYNATCGGVVRMKNTAGSIVKNNSNPLGSDKANAIEGVVDWNASSAGQTVQGLWYERMVISGGADKTVATDVYITGDACATPLAGYADLSTYPFYVGNLGGANTFNGTLFYAGDAPQTVFPIVGAGDTYNNISLFGDGAKTIPPAGVVTLAGTIALADTTSLSIAGTLNTATTSTLNGSVSIDDAGILNAGAGDLTFAGVVTIDGTTAAYNVGAGATNFDGNVNVTQGAITAVNGDGAVTVGDGATLALAATTSVLSFDDNTNLFLTGDITNAGNGTNLAFNCGSTVTYNSATAGQLVLPTLDADGNRYGNLILNAGNKVGGTTTYGNNVNVCTDFTLAGGDLDMRTNSGFLQMNSAAGIVTYGAGTGTEEVLGAFRRKLAATGDVALATPYTFNNYKTTVTFTDLPDASATAYLEMNVRRDQSPNQYDAGTDINRKVTLAYDIANFQDSISVGYLASEVPGTFTSPLTENDLKFFEADGAAVEKVSGFGYNRNTTDPLRHVALGRLAAGTGAVDGLIENGIASTHDILLRANNTMYSIVDGRWSNPNVWDEGRIPVNTDNVEVRTMVYVGVDGPFAGTTGGSDNVATSNTRAEKDDYGTDAAANIITIGNFAGASLIMGNEDNGADWVFHTGFAGTAFLNKNTNAPTVAFPIPAKNTLTLSSDADGLNGLWLTNYGANIPILGTRQIQNEGSVNNQGIIEIGE